MSLLDSLISHWSLDEASGNALDDHGSNDLTETSGTIGAATGKVGGARDFEAGDTEYFTIADNADLSTGDIDFTIAAWVQLETKPGGHIAHKGSDEWGLSYDLTQDLFRFWVRATGAGAYQNVFASNLGSPSTATWYFIVAWHHATANTTNIQVNNGTANQTTLITGPGTPAGAFFLGAFGGFTDYWDGLIDNVSFWKRLLTADERTQLYNGGNGLAYSEYGGATFIAKIWTRFTQAVKRASSF